MSALVDISPEATTSYTTAQNEFSSSSHSLIPTYPYNIVPVRSNSTAGSNEYTYNQPSIQQIQQRQQYSQIPNQAPPSQTQHQYHQPQQLHNPNIPSPLGTPSLQPRLSHQPIPQHIQNPQNPQYINPSNTQNIQDLQNPRNPQHSQYIQNIQNPQNPQYIQNHQNLQPNQPNQRIPRQPYPESNSNNFLVPPNDSRLNRQANPFGVIYGSSRSSQNNSAERTSGERRSSEDIFGESKMHSSSYFEIERNFQKGRIIAPSRGVRLQTPPVVTIVDDSALKRSNSVVSRSASLRNRNRIKSRLKTVLNKDVEEENESIENQKRKKKDSALRFIFPVKRKTSLKYTSIPNGRQKSTPDFQTNAQLQKFLISCNANEIVRELIPKRMQLYNYHNVIRVHPKLNSVHEIFDIDQNNNFQPIKVSSKTISQPLKSPNVISHSRNYSNIKFKEIVYQKYKDAVFANKLRRVPKFEEMFPNDINLLNEKEIKQINVKILFEILMRRTVAAKIQYRLNNAGFHDLIDDETTSSRYSSSFSYSSSSNGYGQGSGRDINRDPGLEDDNSSNGTHSRESINTDELMQQNASLISGLLPSPQISYASDLFGSIDFESPLRSAGINNETSYDHKSIKTGNSSTLDPYKFHSETSPKITKKASVESLYINDFNKSYQQKYNTKLKNELENTLFNSKVYQLRPINRSVTTFSSGEDNHPSLKPSQPPQKTEKTQQIQEQQDTPSDKSSSSTKEAQSSSKRKSYSTSNTSVFQHLEDLSSELSSIIQDDDKQESSKRVKTETILPIIISGIDNSGTTSTTRQQHQIKITPGPQISTSAHTLQNSLAVYDIKSLHGSISEVSPTDYAHSIKPESELDTINENGLSSSYGKSSPGKVPTIVIGRNDSNSTRSMISSSGSSSHAKELNNPTLSTRNHPIDKRIHK
ncbi:uncharacterized protein RJT21DRAFT_119188 [Scheffersomyces amazonensis]|uniref:uncharacterized protein n=1 Tax=Scheffersomyces amazonensis TaxID=1078765 RepID=UPI00315DD452